jgi:archaeal chaperonin
MPSSATGPGDSQVKRVSSSDVDERLAALLANASAIAAIASAVEGTLGPKGLNSMLVDRFGDVTITNDGATILEKIDVNHPAAQLLINTARAQAEQIGDGTTTATILAAAMVAQGVMQVQRGVPVSKVIEGVEFATQVALDALEAAAQPVALDDPLLAKAARVAGRQQDDLAYLAVTAARLIPPAKLVEDPAFRLGKRIIAREGAENEVVSGVILDKQRLNRQMPVEVAPVKLLLLDDALEPEEMEQEALGTEAGFQRYLQLQADFQEQLKKLSYLGVNCVMTARGISERAEEALLEQGVLAVRRVSRRELAEIAQHVGARLVKRTALRRSAGDLAKNLGSAERVEEDERLGLLRVTGGGGETTATMVVGAATRAVRDERRRIAEDAASAVQAALQGGLLPGGGAAEIAAMRHVASRRSEAAGMAAYGVDCVLEALKRPLAQIVANAGFNPLEKVEEVIARGADNPRLAVDCDTGQLADMLELGVVDAAPVKLHALQAAAEIACAVLRINTIIRKRDERAPVDADSDFTAGA